MVRAWPLELINGSPLQGAKVSEQVTELRANVAPELFAGFSPAHFPSTSLPAFALTAAAYRVGSGRHAERKLRSRCGGPCSRMVATSATTPSWPTSPRCTV